MILQKAMRADLQAGCVGGRSSAVPAKGLPGHEYRIMGA